MTNLRLQFLDVAKTENKFGEWLKERRTEKGWSMQTLGDKAGVSKQYVGFLEKGEPHVLTNKIVTPAIEVIDALAEALSADINEARLAAGYAPKHSLLPDQLKEIDFNVFNEKGLTLLVNYINFILSDATNLKDNATNENSNRIEITQENAQTMRKRSQTVNIDEIYEQREKRRKG